MCFLEWRELTLIPLFQVLQEIVMRLGKSVPKRDRGLANGTMLRRCLRILLGHILQNSRLTFIQFQPTFKLVILASNSAKHIP